MTLYRNVLVVLFTAVFFMNVPDYLNILVPQLAPIGWLIGLYVLSVPVLAMTIWKSDIVKSPVIIWCFGFLWVSLAWFFLSSQSDNTWQVLRWHVYSVLVILGFLMLIGDSQAIRFARYTVLGCVLFGVAVNVYEFFVPMAFSRVAGRSAGLYLDPNMAGEALLMGMIVSLTLFPAWCRGAFMLIVGIGICLTLSRSNILLWIIASCSFMLLQKVEVKYFVQTVIVALVLAMVTVVPMWDRVLHEVDTIGTVNKDVISRFEWFLDPTGVADDSSAERKLLAAEAWSRIAERPLLGAGTGASYMSKEVVGQHNQYLVHMEDFGLLGALAVPLLMLAVAWKARGEAKSLAMIFGGIVMLEGFFAHTILDFPTRLVIVAIVAALVWSSRACPLHKIQVGGRREKSVPKAVARSSSNVGLSFAFRREDA